jgi:hypothetical protein
VDENTQLRWDVADADASFADMERGWQRKREEFRAQILQCAQDREREKTQLITMCYPNEDWSMKQRHILICFTEWKNYRYITYSHALIGKVAQCSLLPQRDMMIKISWMAWRAWRHERVILKAFDLVSMDIEKNKWLTELKGTVFRMWRVETMSVVYESKKIHNNGNMSYHAKAWFKMMRTESHRKRIARKMAERQGRARNERLVEKIFECWKRWDAQGFLEVCDLKSYSLHSTTHRCFSMWAVWTWSANNTPGWSEELIALQQQIPKVRQEWEIQLQHLEDKLEAIRKDGHLYSDLDLPLPGAELERLDGIATQRTEARMHARSEELRQMLQKQQTQAQSTKHTPSREPLSPKPMHQLGVHNVHDKPPPPEENRFTKRKTIPNLRRLMKDMTLLAEKSTLEERVRAEAKLYRHHVAESSVGTSEYEEMGMSPKHRGRAGGHTYPRMEPSPNRFRDPSKRQTML